MAKARIIRTSFSKGELDPLIDGRPDLAATNEGARALENWYLMRQGGVTRRPGLRFISEVDDVTKDTILIPFEASVDASYMIEFGDLYVRFIKNKRLLLDGSGNPIKLVSPYTVARIREIHFTQSVDVLFLFQADTPQHKISRISDTSWSIVPIVYKPTPSFQADINVLAGATLTPAAVSGDNVTFTAAPAAFLSADVGRQIIFGASRAIIKSVGAGTPTATAVADIIDAFPNTLPIPSGSWFLRGAPQTPLDPNIRGPIGAQVTLTATASAFRSTDIGRYIVIYAGIVRITHFDSVNVVRGEIVSIMEGTSDADPAAAPAGAWTLETPSWSAATGYPRTGEFYTRLAQAATYEEPTTLWLSDTDDFDNYATGIKANQAIEYTIRTRQLNRIEWLADNRALFIGTSGSEHKLTSGKEGEPIGGDKIPLVEKITTNGVAPIQPIVADKRTLFLDRSRKKLFTIAFDIQEDNEDTLEITGIASHITGTGIRLGPIAFARRPDPRLYMIREDGTLVTLTYFVKEKVIGFTRLVTDGEFEAVGCIPQAAGQSDAVYVVVKRRIEEEDKRYIEMLDDECAELDGREWQSLQTDSAVAYDLEGTPTSILTGLAHLEGKVVDVITDGSYRGTATVQNGQIELVEDAIEHAEVGIHYRSAGLTMRPNIDGQIIEGLSKQWSTLSARLYKSMGGRLNGQDIEYQAGALGTLALYTGDVIAYPESTDKEGRINFEQDLPYPMTILCFYGELEVGDHA